MNDVAQNPISIERAGTFDTKDYQGQLLAEYTALRAEVTQRMSTRHQLLTFSIVVLSAIIAFDASLSTLYAYPVLGVFLALGWAHNDLRIAELGEYIRLHLDLMLRQFY